MRLKKLIIATILGGLGMWIVAGIWHNLIMANLNKNVHATHDGIGYLLIAYFILSLIMAYIYPLGYKGKKPIFEGLRFGVIIGILWILPHGIAMVGAHGDSLLYVLKNTAWHVIEQGIGGIIVGVIYGGNNFKK